MPLMTNPLAHVESLLEKVTFDMEEKRRACRKLTAEIETLDEMRRELKYAIEEERKKLPPLAAGDGVKEKP